MLYDSGGNEGIDLEHGLLLGVYGPEFHLLNVFVIKLKFGVVFDVERFEMLIILRFGLRLKRL